MPMPMEYRTAQRDFDAFMLDLRDQCGLTTTHQTYTMLEAVLLALRRRLTQREVVDVADSLPPVLRALFIKGWDPALPPVKAGTGDERLREVRSLRPDHNLSPPTAIGDVAASLRRAVGDSTFETAFLQVSPETKAFWSA